MKTSRIILVGIIAFILALILIRYSNLGIIYFVTTLLLTTVYFGYFVLRPSNTQRKSKKDGPSYRFHTFVARILYLSTFIALVLFSLFSINPPPPPALNRHTDEINQIVFSNPFGLFASGGKDGIVHLWDAGNDKPIREFPVRNLQNNTYESLYHNSLFNFTSAAYSPDGAIFAFGSTDKTIRIWNLHDNVIVRQLIGHSEEIKKIIFSPDGTLLASASADKTIRIWRMSDGTLVKKIEGHTDQVTSLAFSPDGRLLASGATDKLVFLWQTNDWAKLRQFEPQADPILDLTIASDSQTLVAITTKRAVRRWRIADGAILDDLYKNNPDQIASAAFSPNATLVAVGSSNKTIQIWNTITGAPVTNTVVTPVTELKGHTDLVTALTFNIDGTILLSGSKDKSVRSWQVANATQLKQLSSKGAVSAIAFSNGKQVAIVPKDGEDKNILLWDYTNGQVVATLDSPTDEISLLAFANGLEKFVSVTHTGYIRLWKIEGGALLSEITWHPFAITSIAVNPASSDKIAVGNAKGTLRLLDFFDGSVRETQVHTDTVTSITFNPSGNLIATASRDGFIRISKTSDFAQTNTWKAHNSKITKLLFSSDGKTLVSVGLDHQIILWQLVDSPTNIGPTSSKLLASIKNDLTAITMSADNKILITADTDGFIRLWDIDNANLVESFPSHAQAIKGLGLQNDFILAAGTNSPGTEIIKWDVVKISDAQGLFNLYQIKKWFLDSESLRLFWAVVLGLIFTTAIVLLPVRQSSGDVAHILMSQYSGLDFPTAVRFAMDLSLGLHNIIQTVSDGKLITLRKPSPFAQLGGPGMLIVEEGNVVVLVRSGAISRIVGYGITFLAPFERPSLIVYLGTIHKTFEVSGIVTLDKIVLEKLEIFLDYRVNPGTRTERGGTYPYDKKVITRIWSRKGGEKISTRWLGSDSKAGTNEFEDLISNWDKPIVDLVHSAVRDVIAQHNLGELIVLSGPARIRINEQIKDQITNSAHEFLGVEIDVVAVGIDKIAIPEKAIMKMWELWLSQMDEQIARSKAAITVTQLESQGAGEAVALSRVEGVKNQFRDDLIAQLKTMLTEGGQPLAQQPKVAVQVLNLIEELSKAIIRDDVGMMRYLESLEKFAHAPGDKTIVLGADSSWASSFEKQDK